MPAKLEIEGQKYGMLTVLYRSGSYHGHTKWRCVCDCGKEGDWNSNSLRMGTTISCGCYKKENTRDRFTTHGHTIGKRHSVEHNCWTLIKSRCYNPKNKCYHRYGARGIKVCDRWINSFEDFLNDMGIRPEGMTSIDRINNNGDYEPSNCRWATQKQQTRNKSNNVIIIYNGKRMILNDLALMIGRTKDTIRHHIKNKTPQELDQYISNTLNKRL